MHGSVITGVFHTTSPTYVVISIDFYDLFSGWFKAYFQRLAFFFFYPRVLDMVQGSKLDLFKRN